MSMRTAATRAVAALVAFRYDTARTLDAFADRLRDEVDMDALHSDVIGAVRQTTAPTHARLWLRGGER